MIDKVREKERKQQWYLDNKEISNIRSKLWYQANKEKLKEHFRKYRVENRKKRYQSNKKWRDENIKEYIKRPLVRARIKANYKAGFKIKLTKCEECGLKENLHRHHSDYDKPLEVNILCRSCHQEWHRNNKAIY